MKTYVHTHVFDTVARRKGKRVRYKCSGCQRIGPWAYFNNEALIADVPETDEAETSELNNKTVNDLKLLAKQAGIKGYYKMSKQTLINELTEEGYGAGN